MQDCCFVWFKNKIKTCFCYFRTAFGPVTVDRGVSYPVTRCPFLAQGLIHCHPTCPPRATQLTPRKGTRRVRGSHRVLTGVYTHPTGPTSRTGCSCSVRFHVVHAVRCVGCDCGACCTPSVLATAGYATTSKIDR